jgi:hypothetical protein
MSREGMVRHGYRAGCRAGLAGCEAEMLWSAFRPVSVRATARPVPMRVIWPEPGMAARGGAGGACQVRAAFGPVETRTDERAPGPLRQR